MHKTAVQVRPSISIYSARDMPKRVYPMRVIHMSIEPEDLAENGLDVAEKGLGKPAFFAYPVMASKLGERGGEVCWTKRDGVTGPWSIEAAREVGGGT